MVEMVEDLEKLYQCKVAEECFRHFAEDVEFEDPLTYAHGLSEVKSAWYALPFLFASSETLYKSVDYYPAAIWMRLKQRWTFKLIHKEIEMEHHIFVSLRENEIVRVEDRWHGNQIPNRHNHPKSGSLFEAFRAASGKILSLMVSPEPKNSEERLEAQNNSVMSKM